MCSTYRMPFSSHPLCIFQSSRWTRCSISFSPSSLLPMLVPFKFRSILQTRPLTYLGASHENARIQGSSIAARESNPPPGGINHSSRPFCFLTLSLSLPHTRAFYPILIQWIPHVRTEVKGYVVYDWPLRLEAKRLDLRACVVGSIGFSGDLSFFARRGVRAVWVTLMRVRWKVQKVWKGVFGGWDDGLGALLLLMLMEEWLDWLFVD